MILLASGLSMAADASSLTPAQQKELNTLSGQLLDPGRSGKTKLEAAELLLTKSYPQAIETLKGFLVTDNEVAQIAVAEAIARSGQADKTFIEPLIELLTGANDKVRPSAAKALATYKNHGVTDTLIGIVEDKTRPRQVRLVTVSSLQLVLEKRTVDTLVRLLDDSDTAVQDAAAEALVKLTNIKAFRTNRQLAREWWARNRHKAPSEWLAALADNLARSKAELEASNSRLRERLTQALQDLYSITPENQREALLLRLLGDPLEDVRLTAAGFVEVRISAGNGVSTAVHQQVRKLLSDPDWRVRKAAALLAAHQDDGQVHKTLLRGLETEKVSQVRQSFLLALGQLRSKEAVDVVVREISSADDELAATAASALSRIALRQPLSDQQTAKAVSAIVERYRKEQSETAETRAPRLRESFITAMGALKHKQFAPILTEALSDSEATVRLAAVESLANLNDAELAKSIAPLISDPDRGIRGAVILALGKLNGPEYLQQILARTDPKTESDEAVRKQAWDVATEILTTADVATLAAETDRLAKRPDALRQRIEILKLLVAALKEDTKGKLPSAQLQLGLALLKSSRAAEASGVLRTAYEGFLARKNPIALRVWGRWVDAMLQSDDRAVIAVMFAQADDVAFAAALTKLDARIRDLIVQKKYKTALDFAQDARKELAPRLTVQQRTKFEKYAKQAQGHNPNTSATSSPSDKKPQ